MGLFGSRVVFEQLDCVREDGEDETEVFERAFWAAGQVDDESPRANAGGGAREHGVRGLLERLRAHDFGEAGRFFLDDGFCSFGGNITRGEAGAAGGKDDVESAIVRPFCQREAQCRFIVGEDQAF